MNDRKTLFVWQKRNNPSENWLRYWGNRRENTASILKLVKAMKLSSKGLIGLPNILNIASDCADMGSKVPEVFRVFN